MPTSSNHSPKNKDDHFVSILHKAILYCVRYMSILMVFVIIASVADVSYVVYDKIVLSKPIGVIQIEDILIILGAFIGVLIAIEIFNNIVIYLKEDTVHAKLVLSTALIAVSRKVIILDYKTAEPHYIYALAAAILATALAYWIITHKVIPQSHEENVKVSDSPPTSKNSSKD
jgi:uncharacterized membrane protein (DUF373 family)